MSQVESRLGGAAKETGSAKCELPWGSFTNLVNATTLKQSVDLANDLGKTGDVTRAAVDNTAQICGNAGCGGKPIHAVREWQCSREECLRRLPAIVKGDRWRSRK
jgi:hypothetical protein